MGIVRRIAAMYVAPVSIHTSLVHLFVPVRPSFVLKPARFYCIRLQLGTQPGAKIK